MNRNTLFAALAVFPAALGDGHVDHAPPRFAQQPEREAAHDAFVVGMGRKKEHAGGVGSHGDPRTRRETSQGEGASEITLAGGVGDELSVGMHRRVGRHVSAQASGCRRCDVKTAGFERRAFPVA